MHTFLVRFTSAGIAVLLAAILFIAVNVIANVWFSGIRLDATENGIYTTSNQVASIFENIEEPITVRLYFSQRIAEVSPRHGLYYQRTKDILSQYSEMSGGLLRIEIYDPEPFTDVEDRAVGFGLQAVPLDELGETGYFGLAATNSTDDQEIIPFFNLEREQFLEYDLAKLIFNLSNPDLPKVGLISSLPVEGGVAPQMQPMGQMNGRGSAPWVVVDQIREFFEVESLPPGINQIPEDISILLLVQPTDLSHLAQYTIDQFVLRGGKVLAFVDPNVESVGPVGQMQSGDLSGIRRLMESWGVKLSSSVVGDRESAMRVNTGQNGRPMISDYVAWMEIRESGIDPDDVITGDLNQLNFGTAGALEKVEGASSVVTPLVLTSPNSMRIPAAKFVGLSDVVGLFRDFVPQNQPESLAVRVSGMASSAFESAPAESGADAIDHISQSLGPIQVIIVSDTDFLTDRFWTEVTSFLGQQLALPRADNASFVVNALENLSGSPALSSLRARSIKSRPFEFIQDIRRQAELQYRESEERLNARLDELEADLQQVQTRQSDGQSALLTEGDKKIVENYRGEILKTRRELRNVQRALREDIESVESLVTFLNIGAVPVVFGLVITASAIVRQQRRRISASKVLMQ